VQRVANQVLHSASDLVHFLECEHLTTLDLLNLDATHAPPTAQDDAYAQLIQDKGVEHERRFLETLQRRHASVVDINAAGRDLDTRVAATSEAMREGVQIVYQATRRDGPLIGHADFLRRMELLSALGAWQYEVLDTKLARNARAKFLVQLAFYSAQLGRAQGAAPAAMHVVLGTGEERAFRCADYARYVDHQPARYLDRVAGTKPAATYPGPCEACEQCRWRDACAARRVADGHLCQVANVTRLQTRRLQQGASLDSYLG